jgi:hypothetical protein
MMDFVYKLILILHFIGLASVVGGFLVQMKSPEKGVNPAMLHGALTQLVTGLLLVGLPEMGLALPYPSWEGWDNGKIAVKLLFTVIIAVLAFVGRKKPLPQTGFWGAIGGLSIANVFIAVLWQ